MASLSRKDLYEKVWSAPMQKVAKELSISDVGLAKVCRKHNVPSPPRGYWNKKSAGHNPRQIALPDPETNPQVHISGANDSGRPKLVDAVSYEVSEYLLVPFKVDFKDHLRGAHTLVAEANTELLHSKSDSDGYLDAAKSPLALQVSKATLHRALRIMDAVLRAFDDRRFTIEKGPAIEILGISIRLRIFEPLENRKEPDDSPDLSGDYEFRHNRFRSTQVLSGRLTLEIVPPEQLWLRGIRHIWRDTPTRALETRLDDICTGLISFAGAAKQEQENQRRRDAEFEAAQKRREEEARQLVNKRAAFAAARKKLDGLIDESTRWQRSRVIRRYLKAAKEAYLKRHGSMEPDSEMAKWLDWAHQQAVWLDPLTDSPPSILDDHF